MILYRGDRWVAEFIIQNNLRRFSTGEQEHAVGGFAFYLETLGLVALPWSAVVPVAIYLYYRGETHLTKRDIVVMKEPEPKSMNALFDKHEGTGSALWFITVEPNAKRLASRVPKKYRERVEEKYRSFHYVMMRVQLDAEPPTLTEGRRTH